MKLQLAASQRFTCQQCGQCCRGAWVVVTPEEVERYRKAGVARLYVDEGAGPEVDPFEPVGHGHFRIRKRADGACGFLSAENRCRIHEELGGAAKPLACRVFPFRFHEADGRPLVTTSAACPTIVRNAGQPLATQAREIAALRAEWVRAFPEPAGALHFARGRPLEAATLLAIREWLVAMLERADAADAAGLASAVERMAGWIEDLSRYRVARLKPQALAEYVALTGRHASTTDAPAPPTRPSAVTRLLAGGFLFTVAAVRDQAASASGGISRQLRRAHQLAHLHGLAPATSTIDRSARRRAPLDTADPDVVRIVRHALRSAVEGLGTGRRPLVDELAVAAATLAAGLDLAAMAAVRAGRDRTGPEEVIAGITASAQLGHADTGALAAILPSLAGGADALRLVAARLADQRAGAAADR